ncbi:MAG: NAD(P)/FAD-dependent oxidoreductase [Candidatus Tectimicrobiota bacterium]
MPSHTSPSASPHVVIIGGGFGGLTAARALKRAPVRLTLVDRRNHHLFQPLLYQVASAALNASDIAYPLRAALRRQQNARVLLANVTAIDPAAHKVLLEDGELTYDYVIVATGATHAYFGHDAWAAYAPGLKTIEDALDIRRRVLLAYEAAERDARPEQRRAWLTFVVIGGGPTGVELAGALAEIARHALAKDFRAIDPTQARILLLEGGERLLLSYDPSLSAAAQQQLMHLGVEVQTKTLVTGIDAHGVSIGETRLAARTVLWAAGVAASPLARSLGVPLDRAGRVQVQPDLTIPGHPEVFVIGDLAAARSQGQPVPGVAPAAIQGGRHAARCIRQALAGQPTEPFHYRQRGDLATIGRAAAVADFGWLKLTGWLAWMAWMLVHIAFLIGFRNRVFVLLSWIWAYLTFQRGARLITGGSGPFVRHGPGSDGQEARAETTPAPPERATPAESTQLSRH